MSMFSWTLRSVSQDVHKTRIQLPVRPVVPTGSTIHLRLAEHMSTMGLCGSSRLAQARTSVMSQ